jgi:hypothetical protein
MKSTRKPFYNHRIAQSKEKWETDFLSKIEKANDLLYLAAVKSNGYTPLPKDDSYYTEENKQKILSTLEEVVSNPYNQRHHKNFADLKNQAIEILNQIVQFAAQNGRSWKAQLLGYWYRGEAVPGFPLLYGLRNHTQYGPRWLNNVKLPHILKLAGAANCSNRKETL